MVLKTLLLIRARLFLIVTPLSVVRPSLKSPPPTKARLPRITTSLERKRPGVVSHAAAEVGTAAGDRDA